VSPIDGAPADLVVVGRVIDAYGLKGGIKVQPFSDDPQALLKAREWWIEEGQGWRDVEVFSARMHGQTVTATLVGVSDRDLAERLKGRAIGISRARFPVTEDSEYYWVDLIGLEVMNPAGDVFGAVSQVLDHSAHPILEVESADVAGAGERVTRLIPFVAAIVLEVDLKARRIVVDWQLDY
jgi:16S rRNA processing protein RimM